MQSSNPVRWRVSTWLALFFWLLPSVWANLPHRVTIEDFHGNFGAPSIAAAPEIIEAESFDGGASITVMMPAATTTHHSTIYTGWPRSYISHCNSPPSKTVMTHIDYWAAFQNCGMIILVLASIIFVLQAVTRFSTRHIFVTMSSVAVVVASLVWLVQNELYALANYTAIGIYFSPMIVSAMVGMVKLRRARQSQEIRRSSVGQSISHNISTDGTR